MAYIKLMIEMCWLNWLHDSITGHLHAPLRFLATMARENAASPLSGLQPVALRHNTSTGLLSQGALSMSYKKFFFKSSVWGSFSKSTKSFKAAIPGQNNLWIRNSLLEKQTVLLEMIPHFAFYEDDLRLSPLTGLVITADWGCRG